MASETCKHPCRVQSCISEPTGSTLLRSSLSFKGLDKLVGAYTLSPRPLNIPTMALGPFNALAVAFVDSKAPPKVYSNKEVQDII